MRTFLGCLSYYRSFCANFASIAEPLYELIRKNTVFQCNERRLHAFNELKRFLTSSPVLALPCDDGLYVLDVNASLTAAGAVLQQYRNGVLRVTEYASRTFSRPERNYCTTRREMSALIFGLKCFRQYLLGRKFLVRVDHMALVYFRRTREPTGQLARRLDFIAEFNFDLEYRSGPRSHQNADALSRLSPCEIESGFPCRQCNRRVTGQHDPVTVTTAASCINQVTTRARSKQRAAADAAINRDTAGDFDNSGTMSRDLTRPTMPPEEKQEETQ